MPEQPTSKKRKLRKGTHSCWECKRRKARCIFSTGDDTICVGCRRRGTNCVNQEESDNEPETKDSATNRRLSRIEGMLATLLERQAANDQTSAKPAKSPVPDFPSWRNDTPHQTSEVINRQSTESRSPSVRTKQKLYQTRPQLPRSLSSTFSETLHDLLPSQEECRRICGSTKFIPCFFQQMLTRDWKAMSASQDLPILTPNRIAKLPPPDVHPVLIAQKMLMLACLAQFVSRELNDEEWKSRAEHMAVAAIDVIAREELCHSVEGLECLMLEATYHANNGDMRGAFSAVRRAMACAQLLGIHRPWPPDILRLDNAAPPFDPAYMWYRIVSADRVFSLVLGLPQGYSNLKYTHARDFATVDPEEHLERQHSEITSWILDRNERDLHDMVATHTIDQALQEATPIVPPEWWLPPALSSVTTRRDMFLETTRLVNQVLHFNLLNQNHLPYLHFPGPLYGYNKAACAAASREVLHRYLILQDSGFVAHTCHIVEFFSLIAAMTLTLAHLERHWQNSSQELSVLTHMRASDRAMVEHAKTHMARLTGCKGSQILEHLLRIEDEAFHRHTVGSGSIVKDLPGQGQLFEMMIPYFGVLRLNATKICFSRETDIKELSLVVKDREGCDGMEQMAVVGDFDFDAFVGDLGTSGEFAELESPLTL